MLAIGSKDSVEAGEIDARFSHQSGHHQWLRVCSPHHRVVYLINPLKAYTASFTAAGRAADIQFASSQ